MSCISMVGREQVWNAACDIPLPRRSPKWTISKQARLEGFGMSPKPRLRAVAAAHPMIPRWLLTRLLMDPNVSVRRCAVKNPTLTDSMLKIALADSDVGIVMYAKMIQEEIDDA